MLSQCSTVALTVVGPLILEQVSVTLASSFHLCFQSLSCVVKLGSPLTSFLKRSYINKHSKLQLHCVHMSLSHHVFAEQYPSTGQHLFNISLGLFSTFCPAYNLNILWHFISQHKRRRQQMPESCPNHSKTTANNRNNSEDYVTNENYRATLPVIHIEKYATNSCICI